MNPTSYTYLIKNNPIVTFRAINWLSLIGNIGGYVGICLGYSLLQLPNVIHQAVDRVVE